MREQMSGDREREREREGERERGREERYLISFFWNFPVLSSSGGWLVPLSLCLLCDPQNPLNLSSKSLSSKEGSHKSFL
jgi:hypothetical protein